jgi:hypothetical protein
MSVFTAAAPREQLERVAKALLDNGFDVHVVDTVSHAKDLVLSLIPDGWSVFTASSETLRLSGVAAEVDGSGRYRSVRAEAGDLGDDVDARIRLGATPDVVLGSVHAVTEDGRLVIASASGSQFSPYASGARQAIWMVGAQKVVPDLPTGLERVRSHSLALERQRLGDSFIGKILIIEREFRPGRGTVVLIGEPIGF